MLKYYIKPIQTCFEFNGRIARKEFWLYVLMNFIVTSVITIITGGLGTVIPVAIAIMTASMGVRRLHDIGKSGGWYLLNLIPLLGNFIFVMLCILPSIQGPNKYGDGPTRF